MTDHSEFSHSSYSGPYLPIPLSRPFFTYILLGIIVLVWLLMEFSGGSTEGEILIQYGANFGPFILQGQTWRLFTSMFLHIGMAHLVLNAFALFFFGLEVERLYGPDRFITIYVLAGLFGSLGSFAYRGPEVLSAGASGAIFGIIGTNLAYFMTHKEALGQFGRSRLTSTLMIIGLNLFFGLTVRSIDNVAHMGGLIAGFLLGYGLVPRYQIVDTATTDMRVEDRTSLLERWWVPILAIMILAMSVSGAITYWASL